MPALVPNSFTQNYIKNILVRVTVFIEESTVIAYNYCNYMNTHTKKSFEIEYIITGAMSGLLMNTQIKVILGYGKIVGGAVVAA